MPTVFLKNAGSSMSAKYIDSHNKHKTTKDETRNQESSQVHGDYKNDKIRAGRIASMKVEFVEGE
jgi:hypothetical protein